MITLICPECRRENEAERIYCHDCGARLDRTALAKEAPKGEDVKETQRRLKSLLDPQRAKMRLMFFKVSKIILGALALAAIVQMILPPEVPPRAKTGEFPPQINLDLENAAMACPDVAEAAVIAIPHPRWGERPLLIVTPRPDCRPQRDTLLSLLAEHFPRWMLPDDVVVVDELPHTATGKVMKTRLRELYATHKLSQA